MWCTPQCFLKVLCWERCFSYYTQEPIIDGLLLYINDLPLGISSTIRLFANDCSLYRTITGPMDNQILQDYLNALSKWEKGLANVIQHRNMTYNLLPYKNEYCYTIYHLDCHTLNRGHHHSYLGITLSQDLTWANHVAQISSSAKQTLGVIRRNFRHTSIQSKSKLYCSLVRPKLEYAGSAWYPYL